MRRAVTASALLAGFLSLNLFAGVSCADEKLSANVKVPEGVGFAANLTYCSLRDCRPCLTVCPLAGCCAAACTGRLRDCDLKLNVAWPTTGKGPFPAVVLIHGGGWLYGSHHDLVPFSLRLARKGYVAVTVSYRLLPDFRFPDPLHDVKCAVRWLRANAARYGADPERVGAFGHSAGGHLACMLGMTNGQEELEGNGGFKGQRSDVACVVCTSGLTDLAQLYASPAKGIAGTIAKRAVMGFVGGAPDRLARAYETASPIRYAGKSSPPTLLICGTKDDVVPNEQSLRLEKRLRDAGAEVRLLQLEGAAHDFIGRHRQRAEAACVEFLDRHLKNGRTGR